METAPVKILLVDDNPADARLLKEMLADSGGLAQLDLRYVKSLDEALGSARTQPFDIILLDLMLPDSSGLDTFTRMYRNSSGVPIVVLTGLTDEDLAAKAVREGAQDYLVKGQADPHMLVRAIRFAIERKRQASKVEIGARPPAGDKAAERSLRMVGTSPGFREVEGLVNTISKTSNTSVLIRGETGTGKGLVANAIHFSSNRRTHPIIEVNCSSIPEFLMEAEMFGYEKGAFTDAKQSKKGLFEIADGGTIFLDEIGDMDIKLQPKLLHFLESRSFRKVGGTRDMRFDLRVIAATNKDLEAMVKEKMFREDLYYRLKVMVINIPPLRERVEDILPLADFYLNENKSFARGKRLNAEARAIFLGYSWPGNVRELKNVIERAMIISDTDDIRPEHLPLEMVNENRLQSGSAPLNRAMYSDNMTLEELEMAHIINVLEKVHGNKTKASNILGISRLTLREKIRRYNLKYNPSSEANQG